MNYEYDKRTVELSAEGETIQMYLLSDKYPRISITVGRKTLWTKLWNWFIG